MKLRSILALGCSLSLLTAVAAQAVAEPAAESRIAPEVTQSSEQAPRASRGLARFFGPDDALIPTPCAVRGRGIPVAIKAFRPDEPDPEPFRGMMLDPMFDAEGRPLIVACYDPNDPPPEEFFLLVEAAMAGLDRFFIGSRWSGTQGTPRNLRWSFVPDGLSIPSGVGEPTASSTLFATMDSRFGGNRALWVGLFEQSFERWAQVAGLTYTRITFNGNDWDDGASWGSGGSSARGDVRIAMKPIDGNGGVLAYNGFPSGGDMVLDSAENWQSSGNNFRFARNIIMHEHGHGIGIAHSCPGNSSKLMEPFLSTSFDGPRQDDVRAAHRHYGDFFGNNNSLAAATDLGALANGQTLNPSAWPAGQTAVPNASRTSIDNNSELDHFKFTVDAPRTVNINLTPVGTNYATYQQLANGSCPSDTAANENAIAIRNLAFDVLNASGQVQLTVDANAIGLGESRSGLLLSPPGTYTVRVRSTTNDNTNVQLYNLSITGVSTPTMAATDGTLNDRVRVTWSAITGATEYRVLRGTSTNKALATQIGTVVPPTLQFDDLTAVGGTNYQYWVDVVQDAIIKPLGGPDTGFTGAPPPATGACCAGTACAILTQTDCTLVAGTYQGDNSACTPSTCAATGACCIGTVCVTLTQLDCIAADGEYLGDGAPCSASLCVPVGACCVGTACQVVTEAQCATLAGEYKGDNEGCAPLQCVPTGACCVGTVCQIMTEAACTTAGGSYLGDDSECLPQICFPTGACCIGTICQVGTQADCLAAGGVYLGDDSECQPQICFPTGACCVAASCNVSTEADCLTVGGVYQGDDSSCTGEPCATAPCPGDYNASGVVDLLDLLAFNADWSSNLGQSVAAGTNGDYNASGVVDLLDLLAFNADWSSNLGQNCP